jgi:hypothetical protein
LQNLLQRWAGRLIFFFGCDDWLDYGWCSGWWFVGGPVRIVEEQYLG